jgi:molybdate transport system substrate-binding protein
MTRAGVAAVSVAALVGVAGAVVLLIPASQPTVEGKVGRTIRLAAAADLRFAFDELAASFEQRYPDIKLAVSYGASGTLCAQLENQAPFDLFLSADTDYPRRLANLGLTEGDPFVYAVGRLVVWVPNNSHVDLDRLGARALLEQAVHKIAIANPRHAPYGRAAEAALRGLGLYEAVRDKLVLGENVAQAAQFVQSGSADAGLFGLSLALAPTVRESGRYWEVPTTAYPPIRQAGVILSWARDRLAAAAVRDFLLSPEGQALLNRHGFVAGTR